MSNLIQRLVAPVLMFGWSLYYFMQVSHQKPQSQYLIRPVFYVVTLLFAVIVYREVRAWHAEHTTDGSKSKLESKEVAVVATLVGGSALYLFLLPYAGFLCLTPVFLALAFRYLKASWRSTLLLAVGLTAFVYIVFDVLLGVPLPAGLLKIG